MILLNKATYRTVGLCILFLISVLLISPPYDAQGLSSSFTNQLESSVISSNIQKSNSRLNLLKNNFPTNSFHSKTPLTNKSMEGVVIEVISTDDAFNGYNLFGFVRQSRLDPSNQNRSLFVTDMEGKIIPMNDSIFFPQGKWVIHSAKFINSTTLLFGSRKGGVLWNIYDNTSVHLGLWGHHDFEYNPLTNTIFAVNYYIVTIDGKEYVFDIIKEYTMSKRVIWSVDTRSFISHAQWCPYQDMLNNTADITHTNSLFFDVEEDVLYFNARNVNTFYKIDHKTGKVLWGLGEYGNFTLFDLHGTPRHNLFFHAHSVEKVDDHIFILFDNDFHNQSNPNNHRSRILEITINETTMTANESWVWTAPLTYYSPTYGDADRLPNGNRLGTFGATLPSTSLTGARLVEVNPTGEIVWEMNLSSTDEFYQSRVYRVERFCLTPILLPPSDVQALSRDNVTIRWQTWYNFRTTRRINGTYTLYIDGEEFDRGYHQFDKFWRPSNLTTNIGILDVGNHSCTVVLADEAGHITTARVTITVVKLFYLQRNGPVVVEQGQKDTEIHWIGDTPYPLTAIITKNTTLLDSFTWNGSIITLDLNSFEVGKHRITLELYNDTNLIYIDGFLATIHPSEAPVILSFPTNRSLMWNEQYICDWELFDHSPAYWSLFVNDKLLTNDSWKTPHHINSYSISSLDEGLYNFTLAVYDLVGHQTSQTTWFTVVSPQQPVINTVPHQRSLQWGQENTFLCWEVHGGSHWKLWKNRTLAYEGSVTDFWIDIQIENWQHDWPPGSYNLTLQISNNESVSVVSTSWLQIWVNWGDAYADLVVTEASMWYSNGKNALGPPDGKFALLYFGYGNGHVTLDMGQDEEILDRTGVDLRVYARGGEYIIYVGSNLSASTLVGNQIFAPLRFLGRGRGNSYFNLENISLDSVRYIQIVYMTGEEVELDAIVGLYLNIPPRPTSTLTYWRITVLGGGVLTVTVIVLFWIRRRKHCN